MPGTPEQTRKLEKVQERLWALHRDLEIWKKKSSAVDRSIPVERFDGLLGHRTCYKELEQPLTRKGEDTSG